MLLRELNFTLQKVSFNNAGFNLAAPQIVADRLAYLRLAIIEQACEGSELCEAKFKRPRSAGCEGCAKPLDYEWNRLNHGSLRLGTVHARSPLRRS
jgi:hypothetical protein